MGKSKGKGWVKIERQIMDHWLWKSGPFDYRSAWIDLILSVNHEDKKILFNGKIINVKRGSMITSIQKLADRWGWSRQRAKRFLELLRDETMITTESTTHGTTVTLVKYDDFQGRRSTDSTTDITAGVTADVTAPITTDGHKQEYKELKNDKNDKEEAPGALNRKNDFIPSLTEIRKYRDATKSKVDPKRFYDYFSANGWKQKNGRAATDWKRVFDEWGKTEIESKGNTWVDRAGKRDIDFEALEDAIYK